MAILAGVNDVGLDFAQPGAPFHSISWHEVWQKNFDL
jgi:hypothetical protein